MYNSPHFKRAKYINQGNNNAKILIINAISSFQRYSEKKIEKI